MNRLPHIAIFFAAVFLVAADGAQLSFQGPGGMWIHWDTNGDGIPDSKPVVTPGRKSFRPGFIYRIKLTHIPGRPGLELYPTLQIVPANPRTAAYLAHNSVPIHFTDEDFDRVQSGNFVTKAIYLPGSEPIVGATRRGPILVIIRMGNKDLWKKPSG